MHLYLERKHYSEPYRTESQFVDIVLNYETLMQLQCLYWTLPQYSLLMQIKVMDMNPCSKYLYGSKSGKERGLIKDASKSTHSGVSS